MPEPGPKRRPVKIDPWARWVSGAVGAAGLGAGGAATFTTSVEAGPVALIAVGTLFLIAALAGVLPNRLKFGDNEAEWGEAVGEALADVVELVGPEDRAEAISSLQNLALVAPETAAPALRGLAYEQLIFGMLASAIATLNEPRGPEEQFRLSTNVRGHGRELDAVIVSPTGAEVAVEIKGYSRLITTRVVDLMQAQLSQWRAKSDIKRVLFVTRTGLTGGAAARLEDESDFYRHVVVEGLQDHPRLQHAIEQACRL